MEQAKTVLDAQNISLAYRGADSPALTGVSFSVGRGEFCGLIGPNGAGKTTLLSVFATLLRPDAGLLSICGINSLSSPRKIRGKIGLVPQELALYDKLTGLENILFFGRMYGVRANLLKEKAAYYLDMFGLRDKANKKVSSYSGGMKRRVNLIVGLIHDPQLLLLDEPTVGIDAQSRHLIMGKLSELNSEDMSMVYSSHYLEEVQQLCQKVTIIDHGQVVVEGEPKYLIDQAKGCGNLMDYYLEQTGEKLRD